MRVFEKYNPFVSFFYFFAVLFVVMFCQNPVFTFLSFLGAASLFWLLNGRRYWRSHIGYLCAFVVMVLLNFLFSHNGATVLFVLNDNPITKEALYFGLAASGGIIAALYWFRCFTQVMTSDRLMYLLGFLSPKASLLFSMSLRFVPLFQRQAKTIARAQKAIGCRGDESLYDTFRNKTRVFSALTTYGLESGIITSESMAARGFGSGKRTFYRLFSFAAFDWVFLACTGGLWVFTVLAATGGRLDFVFYPLFSAPPLTATAAAAYFSYFVLVFLPLFLEAGERLKWKYLHSKI